MGFSDLLCGDEVKETFPVINDIMSFKYLHANYFKPVHSCSDNFHPREYSIMLSQLTLRFPKKLIEDLKSRASAEDTSVNALTEKLLDDVLRTTSPDDAYFALQADPGGTQASLYRKVVRGETFGRQSLKTAELRWLFTRAHAACQTGSAFMSWPVMEALLDITFGALVYAAENGIAVDTHYINRAFDLPGQNYREETKRFMAAMPHNVDTAWAEFLLRPLASGALNLTAFPDEELSRICTPARLKCIFPLVIRAQNPDQHAMKGWAAATGLVTDDLSRTATVADITLHLQVRGNRFPQQPGTPWQAPAFSLFVSAGRVSLALGWDVFSALVRYMQARAWLGATHAWNARDSLVSLYIPRGEGERVILGLDGTHIAMTPDEYLQLETALLAVVSAPNTAPVLAELRALYGDL
uniref:hypothetical protein n=1 Tax=Klebsiella quasipneumoniae TaxID=1463165 RepID=UPI00211BFB40|nr:hypothetical protein [Klebsiella quasipneumoniae]